MSKPREIEMKWVIKQPSIAYARLSTKFAKYFLTEELADGDKVLYADTIDNYWHAHPDAKADIVRLRHSRGHWQSSRPQSLKEFTVKQKDQGNNIDRVEINNELKEVGSFRDSMNMSLKKKLTLRKEETVVWLPGGIVVGMAKVWREGEPENAALIFEIEAPDLRLVKGAEEIFKYRGLMKDCIYEPRSLLEMFDE